MRDVSPGLKTRIAREDTALCRLLTIKTRFGRTFTFTDLSEDVSISGVRYRATPGIEISSLRGSADSNIGNATFTVALSADYLSETDVRFGLLDDADYKVELVDYTSIASGRMFLQAGVINTVSSYDADKVTIDVGDYSNLSVSIGEKYSQRCRNVFGDKRCGVDVDAFALEFLITEIVSPVVFRINNPISGGGAPPPEYDSTTETATDYQGAQDYDIVIPDYDVLTVFLTSGSGAGGNGHGGEEGKAHAYYNLYEAGGSGEDSYFGAFRVPGAPGGFIGGGSGPPQSDNLARYLNETAPRRIGGGRQGGAGGFHRYSGYPGEPGNADRRVWRRGEPGAPAIGSTVHMRVGAGGTSAPRKYQDQRDSLGIPGTIGYATITVGTNSYILPDSTYILGRIEWITGDNTGVIQTITGTADGAISVDLQPPFPVRIGDKARLTPGCSNYADVCENRYNNLKRMHAEPAVPAGVSTDAPATPATKIADTTAPRYSDTSGFGNYAPGVGAGGSGGTGGGISSA